MRCPQTPSAKEIEQFGRSLGLRTQSVTSPACWTAPLALGPRAMIQRRNNAAIAALLGARRVGRFQPPPEPDSRRDDHDIWWQLDQPLGRRDELGIVEMGSVDKAEHDAPPLRAAQRGGDIAGAAIGGDEDDIPAEDLIQWCDAHQDAQATRASRTSAAATAAQHDDGRGPDAGGFGHLRQFGQRGIGDALARRTPAFDDEAPAAPGSTPAARASATWSARPATAISITMVVDPARVAQDVGAIGR